MSVRPIGTEFDYCFPPDQSSSKCVYTVFRYRVTGHALAQRAMGVNEGFDPREWTPYGEPYQVEDIEVIDKKEYHPLKWRTMNAKLVPVPPPECAKMLGERW
jgi:hypothetical protein